MSELRRQAAPAREQSVVMDKEHILLIEDEKNIAELVRYNFQREGYRVASAADGEEGLRLAERELPDLVLLDLLLPRIDGMEVCRRLKQ